MAFSDPASILDSFGLHEGQIVADLGAGSGFYTIESAKRVGEGGKVYAVDVQADLLSRLKNAAHQARLRNIYALHGNMEKVGGTTIRDGSVDAALMCNVLFQIEHREDFVKEVRRILKPGGRALLVDWSDSFGGMGPQEEHVIDLPAASELFEKNGFAYITSIPAGSNHYGVSFRKS